MSMSGVGINVWLVTRSIISHEAVQSLTLQHISRVKESNILQHVAPNVVR